MELDFGQNTPSPKRIKLSSAIPPNKASAELDSDSFTIKSFYGKREKIHFPHSPGRRKAVDKILEKLSDENTDSENERLVKRKGFGRKQEEKKESNLSKFDFHSSDSGDTETEGKSRPVLKQKNVGSNKKVPLEFQEVKRTPRNSSNQRVKAKSTGKIPNKVSETAEQERTPMTTGKKFFKSRSPASADKSFGNLVIKKGFDLKFYPRRLNMSKSKENKSKSASKKEKAKPKPVDKVKASKVKCFDKDSVFFVEDSFKVDGTEVTDSNVETLDELRQMVVPNKEEVVNEKIDSGVETTNSNDLFSSPIINTGDSSHLDNIEKQSKDGLTDEPDKSSEVSSETMSLIGAGSEDLFLSSGQSTPVSNVPSGECTPSDSTPVQSGSGSPSGSSDKSSVVSSIDSSKQVKLFPIFMKKSPSTSSQLSKLT